MIKHNKPFSFFGSLGYQVVAVNESGEVRCWECIPLDEEGNALEGFKIMGYEEGSNLYCDCCNNEIESDYGEV